MSASTTGSPSTASIPLATDADLGLAVTELVVYALMLLPVLWATWKHGKSGVVCWPIFVSYLGLRFAADIRQIQSRNGPLIPDLVVSMTNAGSIACLTLTIIGHDLRGVSVYLHHGCGNARL